MSVNLEMLSQTIIEVARHEDLILRRVGKGIFLVPELALIYAVGRELAIKAESVLATAGAQWLPESIIGESGRTDLVFHVNNSPGLAIEFKCGDVHVDECERALWKLAAIDPGDYTRVFCALIATWPTTISEEPRIERIEKGPVPVKRLTKDLDFFSTFHTAFKNQVCCLIGIWEIDAGFYKPLADPHTV
jgi:hypothetical protein